VEWSTNKETAALLLAEDSLSMPQIAQQLGTSESTIDRWKKVPEFQARIKENIAAFHTKCLESGYHDEARHEI
jgi:IS30 family transposase